MHIYNNIYIANHKKYPKDIFKGRAKLFYKGNIIYAFGKALEDIPWFDFDNDLYINCNCDLEELSGIYKADD